MRIAFVTLEYPPLIFGGSGLYAASLTRELAKKGHQVVVFAPGSGSRPEPTLNFETPEIVPVHFNDRLPYLALQFWLGLPKTIARSEKKEPFDIIHFNSFCYWFLKRKLSRAPHVTTVHHLPTDATQACDEKWTWRVKHIGNETSPVYSFIERRGVKFSDKFIAVSDYTRRRVIERYSIPPEKINTVYPAIDFEATSFSKEELDNARQAWGFPEVPVVLFVGRVDDPRKGLALLLSAFKDVLASHEARLLIVGGGSQVKARQLAAELGFSKNVFFTGKVDESSLRKCYALCTVHVCPSRLEGFGLTLLEAYAAGKPVVATNVGAIPEIVGEKNGSLVEPGDTRAMSNAISYYLENSGLAETMGGHNARDVRRRFDWKTTAKGTEQVYRLVVS